MLWKIHVTQVYHFNNFKVHKSVVFSTFSMSHHYHHWVIPEHSHQPGGVNYPASISGHSTPPLPHPSNHQSVSCAYGRFIQMEPHTAWPFVWPHSRGRMFLSLVPVAARVRASFLLHGRVVFRCRDGPPPCAVLICSSFGHFGRLDLLIMISSVG